MDILELAKRNQQKAWEIIEDTRIVRIWEGCQSESGRFVAYRIIDET
jgi:hypothetical protein